MVSVSKYEEVPSAWSAMSNASYRQYMFVYVCYHADYGSHLIIIVI
jgi:hypothetical protein